MLANEAADLGLEPATPSTRPVELTDSETDASNDCELTLVIGGDGSILRAAEVTHARLTPVLGVNLGHVGFLAEAEHDDVESTIDGDRGPPLHRRGPAHARRRVFRDGELVASTFALNEASVEKAARERMLEVVVEIDGRPLSRWGCDGVVCATPTGSTAYNFSAGGPIVWPEVEALLHRPDQRARPVRPADGGRARPRWWRSRCWPAPHGAGVLWCDGRRTVDLPPGARIEVRRGEHPVRLVRLHEAPFTDRLVAKFGLPVEGWRGSAERTPGAGQMIEEIRIGSLGVIDSSTLELGPGLTVITGETGAGKTMVVTALGLLLGGRADSGAVRSGARQARIEGVVAAGADRAGAWETRGRGGRAGGGRGRARGARPQPVGRGPLARVRGRSLGAGLHSRAGRRAAGRRARPVRPAPPAAAARPARRLWTGSAAPRVLELAGRLPGPLHPAARARTELDEVVATARERAREADLLRFGLGEIEAVTPEAGEDTTLAAEESRLGFADTLRAAAEQARESISSEESAADALAAVAAARGHLEAVREHDAARASSPTGRRGGLPAVRRGRRVASYGCASTPTRRARGGVRARAALTALTRKYGESIDEVLAWAEQSSDRLLDLDSTDERIEELARAGELREKLAEAAEALSRPAPRPPRSSPRR